MEKRAVNHHRKVWLPFIPVICLILLYLSSKIHMFTCSGNDITASDIVVSHNNTIVPSTESSVPVSTSMVVSNHTVLDINKRADNSTSQTNFFSVTSSSSLFNQFTFSSETSSALTSTSIAFSTPSTSSTTPTSTTPTTSSTLSSSTPNFFTTSSSTPTSSFVPDETTSSTSSETSTFSTPSSSSQDIAPSTSSTPTSTTSNGPSTTPASESIAVSTTIQDGKTVVVVLTSLISSTPTASTNTNKSTSGGGLSQTNKIVVGVVVGVGGAILIGILALFFYIKRRKTNEYESGKWTFWRKEEKVGSDEFLSGELGVRDRNINQGSNF